MAIISAAGRVRTAGRVLAEVRTLVEPAHQAEVDRLPDLVRHVVGYHIGWWDVHGQPTSAGGKSIRSALVLAAAATVGGDPVVAVPQAVAVELVHDFSLLHDDIMDGDLIRRHRPAAWSVFGVNETLLAGDVLVSLACDVLAGSPGVKVLTAALLELCAGQSADMAFERRSDVGVEECVAMAAAKTGALLACACELGALAGGGSGRQCRLLGRFGRHVGLAFQLVDDLLGIWGETAVTGKPAHSDLANRKKTLPVVAALASGTPAGDRLAQLYHHERGGDPDAVAHLAELIEEAGGRCWAQAEADRQLDRALTCLGQALQDESAAADLTALAHLIIRRDR
jgi:geranylgeranyl diphosphate synthase, type I